MARPDAGGTGDGFSTGRTGPKATRRRERSRGRDGKSKKGDCGSATFVHRCASPQKQVAQSLDGEPSDGVSARPRGYHIIGPPDPSQGRIGSGRRAILAVLFGARVAISVAPALPLLRRREPRPGSFARRLRKPLSQRRKASVKRAHSGKPGNAGLNRCPRISTLSGTPVTRRQEAIEIVRQIEEEEGRF